MSNTWEEDSVYTQINYQSCKQANDQSIIDTGEPIPEWDNNNKARESLNGVFGILTGHFPDYVNAGPDAYLTQEEALALMQTPVWSIEE